MITSLREWPNNYSVIPAKAGIQAVFNLDSGASQEWQKHQTFSLLFKSRNFRRRTKEMKIKIIWNFSVDKKINNA